MLRVIWVIWIILFDKCRKWWQLIRQDPAVDRKAELDVKGKIAVVTGSNCGLGKQTALELAQRGCHVVMACRDMKAGESARQDIVNRVKGASLDLLYLDLSNLTSVRSFAQTVLLKYPKLDILVNNAGLGIPGLEYTENGFEMHMGVNHLGHFLLTMLLLGHLKKGSPSRIVCLSSQTLLAANLNMNDLMMNHTSLGLFKVAPYCNSKLAIALFAKEFARRLEELKVDGINIYAICPGYVKTKVFRNAHWIYRTLTDIGFALIGFNVKQGCETTLFCALNPGLQGETGKFYKFSQRFLWAEQALDDEMGRKLWDQSEKLLGLPPFSKASLSTDDNWA